MKALNKKYIAVSIAIILAIAAANIRVSIICGVNHRYREVRMPLYVKWTQFLARHYEYERIAREITRRCLTDEEKVLAILEWTRANVRQGAPQGMPLVDDHILNIIIRGYGTSDQLQDVFTTLCFYAGMPAFWDKAYDKAHKVWYPISYVRLNGRWRVFDAYYGKYFKNSKGEIASVEDMISDRSILRGGDIADMTYCGIPYAEFYDDLKPVNTNRTLRPEKQMPLRRFIFEVKKIFGIEKGDKTEVVYEAAS
jgi:hypothetical protein